MHGLNLNETQSAEAREDQGAVVHVRDVRGEELFFDVNGEQKPVIIRIAGTYSKRYRKEAAAQRNRLMKRQRRSGLTGDQIFEESLDLVASCIISWEGIFADDQPYQLTKDNAVELLRLAPWVREDLEAAMSDHESFFSKPSVI